ncbi:hypothetical protein Shyhy01_32410 [Streptomyces hygroscopicus subsp. hygroscopicus]|nr:hypothetical protein Shyhy01_32410 [Streptomyces hygroscopicus subsp. hygroscopicus]
MCDEQNRRHMEFLHVHGESARGRGTAGSAGVNVPAGFVGDGLPAGARSLGPAGSEPLLVSPAAQWEAEPRRHERWPPAPAVAGVRP